MVFSSWFRSWKRSIERRWALSQALRRPSVARRRAVRPRLEALEDRWLLSTYTVMSNADSGAGTLRDAINQADNPNNKITQINFQIGSGAQTISLASQLPALTASGVFINGLSQGGSGNTTPLITLSGTKAGTSADGLLLLQANCTVSGLIIEGFAANGIEVEGSGNNAIIGGTSSGAGNILSGNGNAGLQIDGGVTGVKVQGNYVGTDPTGTKAVANAFGVRVQGSNNTIGGSNTSGALNVISGNSSDGIVITKGVSGVLVQGNYIGLNGGASTSSNTPGSVALANTIGVEVEGVNDTIGGTSSGLANTISGNAVAGIQIGGIASGVQIQGNYIGTDATGKNAVGNNIGVIVASSTNTIGGTSAHYTNTISGNLTDGVFIKKSISGVKVENNWIGTDLTGLNPLGNQIGVEVAGSNNSVGGSSSSLGNTISANGIGGVVIDSSAQGVVVQANYIGTDISGTKALGNVVGIQVQGSNNTIGGTGSGPRNVISGNLSDGVLITGGATGVTVLGNYIGTDVTGKNAVANAIAGVDVGGSRNTIGGSVTGAGNTVSGNTGAGVLIESGVSANLVQGNYVGTNLSGTKALGNATGIAVYGSNNTIGGIVPAAINVISGNSNDGIFINASGVLVVGNYIGTDKSGGSGVANGNGIEVSHSNNTIGGTLPGSANVISKNNDNGVQIDARSSAISGILVQGNFIGTNYNGKKALGNGIYGIYDYGTENTIGGAATAAGNLICANANAGIYLGASADLIQGNTLGLDITGTVSLSKGKGDGIDALGNKNTIGGTTAGAANLIGGNNYGIRIDGTGNLVQGDYIGVELSGTNTFGSANVDGILFNGSLNTIGGTATAARNVISGNSTDGLLVNTAPSGLLVQGNFIGTDVSGTVGVANGTGIDFAGTSSTIGGTAAGAGNAIAFNKNDGVLLEAKASGVVLLGNSIGTDMTATLTQSNGKNGVEVEGTGNTIGGTTSRALNVISANTKDGVLIDQGATGNVVEGNYIGINNPSFSAALGNSGNGVEVNGNKNTIGGTTSGARNIISGNAVDGVLIDSSASGVVVEGNFIGTDNSGYSHSVANSIGVVAAGSKNTIGGTAIGTGNVISGNAGDGVLLTASGVAVEGNYIGVNAGGSGGFGNSGNGVEVAKSGNTIGGTMSRARNVISGNVMDGVLIDKGISGVAVQGNYIGTNATGNAGIANSNGVEVVGTKNVIGGTSAAARNIISDNSVDGVLIDSAGTGVVVEGNYIGTDFTGKVGQGNGIIGVEVAGNGNAIGGNASGARNIISSNGSNGDVVIDSSASGVQVEGNYIGLDVTGTRNLGSSQGVVVSGNQNIIGGSVAGARNVISFNSDGVVINSGATGNQVEGNFIGTNASGIVAAANGDGVVDSGNQNTIGGTATGDRNIISGNGTDGVLIGASVSGVAVEGNYIGTDVTGALSVGNGNGIEDQGSGNTIGGTSSSARNVISGNADNGVLDDSGATGELIAGNYIGINAAGNLALGNGAGGFGVELNANNCTIGGTVSGARNVISGNSEGVIIEAGVSGTQILGNYIGTNPAGTAPIANGNCGVDIYGSTNTIGGTTAAARNVISGNDNYDVFIETNASSNQVWGNYIGTDLTGAVSLDVRNANYGIYVNGTSNTIGITTTSTATTGAGNVISGNGFDGIYIIASSVLVQGNTIGANAAGKAALGNSGNGIEINGTNNTIGGSLAGASNVVSGNLADGIVIDSNSGNSGNQVLGNFVGTNTAGTGAIANSGNGIEANDANNTFGGAGAGNTVSFNVGDGILLDGNATGTQVQGNTVTSNLSNGIESNATNAFGGTATGDGNVVNSNALDGILLDSGASGSSLLGNSIGTDITGAVALGNGTNGLEIEANNVTVGGTTAGSLNLISANSNDGILIDNGPTASIVQGNYIGTDITGKVNLGNGNNGIEVSNAANNTLGGSTSTPGTTPGNLISGNNNDGVAIDGGCNSNVLQGNLIGTDITGKANLGNNGNGVEIDSTSDTVGGTAAGALNIISGNLLDGVRFDTSASDVLMQSNYVGTDVTGSVALANSGNGVELDGFSAGCTVGLNAISGNVGDGVLIDLGVGEEQVSGNYIGTDWTGEKALGNGGNGVELAGDNDTIGGSLAVGVSNVISSNGGDGVLLDAFAGPTTLTGNLIGTDVTGKANLGNKGNGVEVLEVGALIGGGGSSNGNVISGNLGDGVLIDPGVTGVQLQSNYVGTDITGTVALANSSNGVEVAGNGAAIGGGSATSSNVISGNTNDGVLIDSGVSGVVVSGNSIGTNAAGSSAVANFNGIELAGTSNTVVGTTTPGATLNLVSGNTNDGILIDNGASTGNLVVGNFIGTDSTGEQTLGNGTGVEINGNGNAVGGTTSGDGNYISANTNNGVLIDSGATGNTVQGNAIGLTVLSAALGNGQYGVNVAGSNNLIGGLAEGNTIADNAKGGVLLSSGYGNTVSQNSIYANGSSGTGPGIVRNSGANNNVAAPVLTPAQFSAGTLTVNGSFVAPVANVNYVLEFFANPTGDSEGAVFLFSMTVTPTTTGPQPFSFSFATNVPTSDPLITATLTDASGDTSIFSNGVST